jgi:hypothetical protein
MFKYISNLFKKSAPKESKNEVSSDSSPINVSFDDDGLSIFVDDKKTNYVQWSDIVLIAISIEDEFLPFPYWYVGSQENLIRIPNDAVGGKELFFDGFSKFINGFSSDEAYTTIIEASSALEGSFIVWKNDSVKAT